MASTFNYEQYLKNCLAKYKNKDVTKRQILQVFTSYADLKPNLHPHMFNDGSRKDLLTLEGTIPVHYKGSTYNIPVCMYLMETHPFNPPFCYVRPTAIMEIQVGKHVDSGGRVYLPYLYEWEHPKSDLIGLIEVMRVVFGEEPPVFVKSAASQPTAQPPYPMGGGQTPYPVGPPGVLMYSRSSARFPAQELQREHAGVDTEPMDASTSHIAVEEVGTGRAQRESRRLDAVPAGSSQGQRLQESLINPNAQAPSKLLYESGVNPGPSSDRRQHQPMAGGTARGIEIARKEFTIEKDEYGSNKRLGKGSFGTVYLAKWQGALVAVKEYDDEDQTYDSFFREMEYLSNLRHPHIVQLLGICWQPNAFSYLLMTYVDGVDLGTILFRPTRSPVKIPNSMAVKGKIAADLCSAVSYLHDKHDLVHQDIKPGNVLIAKTTLHTYLCDLGVAKLKEAAITSTLSRTHRSAPTPIKYLPPECDDGLTVGKSSDVWCLGCTLSELFSGVYLWDLHGVSHVHFERVLRKKREEGLMPDALLAINDEAFPGVRELLEKAVCYDYKKRISAAKLSERFATMCVNAQ